MIPLTNEFINAGILFLSLYFHGNDGEVMVNFEHLEFQILTDNPVKCPAVEHIYIWNSWVFSNTMSR